MTSLYLIFVFALMLAWRKARRPAVFFLPWVLFAVTYDAMRLYPNYRVNAIDVSSLYTTEKHFFGIETDPTTWRQQLEVACPGSAAAIVRDRALIPSEYFAIHHTPTADFMAGIFYLCWVPVPIGFAIYLYATRRRRWFLRFSWAFLLVNWLGFVGYYIHPAAPPWYAMHYGFTPILHTPGNVAGLGRWDAMTGLPVFHALYGKNANVFAAVPSLHAAYMLVTTIYAAMSRQHRYVTGGFAFICVGIWWTAVYTGHHYIIDVLLGILTALAGVCLWEWAYRFVTRHH